MELEQATTIGEYSKLTKLDNGIHKLVMPPTRPAIDEQFTLIYNLIQTQLNPETDKILLLFLVDDISKVPTGYFVGQARKFWGAHSADRAIIRVAYLVKKNFFVDLLQAFLKTLRFKSERNFFNMEQESEAIEWLLAEPYVIEDSMS